ncbi:glycoside hydrolase family 26 protein [Actinoplanes sp. GCM10030250]|uniref:glycoside hydrolase family 26 protein n=1 Tax=Actinoplanes sp. GCM10030250 TaxID=3273376 RepID=UPI00360B89D6
MTHSHRDPAQARVSRRGLLGLAALAAVPVGTLGFRYASAGDTAPTVSAPAPSASASPTPSATPSPFARAGGKLGGTVPFLPGKALFGAYLGFDGLSYKEALELRNEQLGRKHRIVHLFYGWGDQLPTSIPYLPKGAYPLVSWRGIKYKDILNGKSDETIARAARHLRDLGRPLMLRWGWEMNGGWYDWGGAKNGKDPAGYISCYRRLHRIFGEEGADNVAWVWSPNWNHNPREAWNRTENYYPGDEFVDWVGVSGYNLHQESPATLFDTIYQQFSPRKPIIITETGAMEKGGTTKADWITEFARYVGERPAIGAVTWFDTDTHFSYPEKWRVDTDPKSLAAYRTMAASARFSG